MDFRNALDKINKGELSQEEIIEQILNLPCVYVIFEDTETLHCVDVTNESNGEEIEIPLLYTNLDIAIEAVTKFKTPHSWYVAQWTSIHQMLKTCQAIDVQGLAFDSLPEDDHLGGLVIDRESLEELITLSEVR